MAINNVFIDDRKNLNLVCSRIPKLFAHQSLKFNARLTSFHIVYSTLDEILTVIDINIYVMVKNSVIPGD